MILGKSYLGGTEITKAYLGSDVVYEVVALGTEIITWDDAAANASGTEVNSIFFIDNVQGVGAGARSSSSVEVAESYLGIYSIKIEATNTFAAYQEFFFPTTIGKSYAISFYTKTGVGSDDCRWRTNTGFVTPSDVVLIPEESTTWTKYEWTGIANTTTAQLLLYALQSGSVGEYFLIDNISVIETEAVGTDVVPQDNAASLADLNSIGSFNNNNSSMVVTVDADSFDGDYSIKQELLTGVTAASTGFTFNLVAAKAYVVSFWIKTTQGTAQVVEIKNVWDEGNISVNGATATWTEHVFVRTATATGTGNITVRAASGGVIGDNIFIDKLSIIEI